jgi:DNA-directed RNA polymerase subunit RPC12/RpoP
MGLFDTNAIRCPYCDFLIEDQVKPGDMNYYMYGDSPVKDLDFVGSYTCYSCYKKFTIEMETAPRTVMKKVE